MSKRNCLTTICIMGSLILLFDSKIAIDAAKDGILLCICTLIPSMFPFLITSSFLVKALQGHKLGLLRKIGCICGIPSGGESIFLTGLIGGYPIGAKLVADAYQSGSLSKKEAEHMLAFCSNAGPAFIFGVVGTQFSSLYISWIIWSIQIISAIFTGYLFKDFVSEGRCTIEQASIFPTKIIENSTKTMAIICTWVFIFRIIIQWLDARLLHLFPPALQVTIGGMIELTNGCIALSTIYSQPLRFIICNMLLSFGGLCVMMQTSAVASLPGLGKYFQGKIVQTFVCIPLSLLAQCFLFNEPISPVISIISVLLLTVVFIVKITSRKNSRFSKTYAI